MTIPRLVFAHLWKKFLLETPVYFAFWVLKVRMPGFVDKDCINVDIFLDICKRRGADTLLQPINPQRVTSI